MLRLTLFRSWAPLESTVRNQVTNIPALVEDSVVRLFGHVEPATKSAMDSKVMVLIRTVVSLSVPKAFQSSAFQTVVKQAVHRSLVEQHVSNDVATSTIYLPFFAVSVPKFVKNEVEKRSLETPKED